MTLVRRILRWTKRIVLGVLWVVALILYASHQTNAATNDEFAAVAESFEEVRRASLTLGSRPLVVITPGQNSQGEWDALQRDLLTHSSNSRRIVAEGSGHYVQDDRPALVIDAIREVVEMLRQSSAAGAHSLDGSLQSSETQARRD
jgi:pimeloyl-ACP methyl ester carboxylesterase